jgi:T5orf172 domain
MTHRMLLPHPGFAQMYWWEHWATFAAEPMPESFVYMLRAEGDTPIKVGVATDVQSRIASLQTGNSRRLELLALLLGSYPLERALHCELSGYCVRGEWFDDGSGLLDFVARIRKLSEDMMLTYRTEKRIPDFEEYSPYRELAESESQTVPWAGPRRSRAAVRRGPSLHG